MKTSARSMWIRGWRLFSAGAFALALGTAWGIAQGGTPEAGQPAEVSGKRIVREGIAVELDLEPASGPSGAAPGLREGEEAYLGFTITDTTTGSPLTGLRPAAWMDARTGGQPADAACRQKVQSFLQGSLGARPEIDLNTYYLLALNREPSISVIDPLLGFGSSKLLAMVPLPSPGEDWVLSRDGTRLFVSMPGANRLAVVDTATWKVVAGIQAGPRPTRLALQPDGKYLWVGNDAPDAESGVTVIEATEGKVVAHIRTGAGHHELAFSGNDRYAYVTNTEAATLSIIDVQRLARIKDVQTGPSSAGVAFSALSQAVYVPSEADGAVLVVDAERHEVLTRLPMKPGLGAIRFAPGGRWGFAVNRKEGLLHILDASTNRLLHTLEVGKAPDQIVFTANVAYIRSTATETVSMIPLNLLGGGQEIPVSRFPAGQTPPEQAGPPALADAIVPAPEGNAVLVANPADRFIYYYTEGMAAPMGSFQNYRREPRAVLVVDRSLRETSPGVYATTVKLPHSGAFDLVLLLDSPRIVHCFEVTVQPNPDRKTQEARVAAKVEPLVTERKIPVGESFRLRFRVTDSSTNGPKSDLKDVGVTAFLAPGIWQTRAWAQHVGEGVYEVSFAPPKAGVYYIFFQVPSLGVRYQDLPSLILQAVDERVPSAAGASKDKGGENK